MEDYNDFLAGHVLNDEEIITYRKLSRILNVHVNVSKQMLYAFYESSNKIHPNSCHATFIVHGRQEPPSEMSDSQPQSSIDSSSSTKKNEIDRSQVIALVPEEQLEEVKASFIEIRSIHIYSLEPGRFSDSAVLATVDVPSLDELSSALEVYGFILNEDAKKTTSTPASMLKAAVKTLDREAMNGSLAKDQSAPRVDPQQEFASQKKSELVDKPKKVSQDVQHEDPKASVETTPDQPKEQSTQPPKREPQRESKPKTKKLNKPKPERPHSPMEMDTKDDTDSEELIKSRKKKSTAQEARDMEELRSAMLEDEAMSGVKEDGEADEASRRQQKAQPMEPNEESQPSQEEPQPQRRRGRRKVIRKDTTRDDKGYLVTRDKVSWESYSEDEQPTPQKPKAAAKAPSVPAKKTAVRKGQGDQRSIMSFFGKG